VALQLTSGHFDTFLHPTSAFPKKNRKNFLEIVPARAARTSWFKMAEVNRHPHL
jgi:hypothetical protein